jgi:hypothetical protein
MYWSVIELNVGILAVSIPSYKILVKKFLPRVLGSYSGGEISGAPRYGHRSRQGPYSMDRMKSRGDTTKTTVTGGTQLGSANDSEEQIIIPDGMIVRTMGVTVEESSSDDLRETSSQGKSYGM